MSKVDIRAVGGGEYTKLRTNDQAFLGANPFHGPASALQETLGLGSH